jgi:hypothetical protein
MAADRSDPAVESPVVGHRWKPITDLPLDWEALASRELRALTAVWEEQRGSLRGEEALKRFQTS